MLPKEAHNILMKKNKGLKAIKCFEYASRYVFQVVPENFDMSKDTSRLLDTLCSVDKKTSEVRDFKPFHIPIEEYKRGREIKYFK